MIISSTKYKGLPMSILMGIFRKLFVICFVSLCLLNCSGEGQEDWEIDKELCEAQDGEAELFHVSNIETGQSYIETRCTFQKQRDVIYCKPDNGFGGEC